MIFSLSIPHLRGWLAKFPEPEGCDIPGCTGFDGEYVCELCTPRDVHVARIAGVDFAVRDLLAATENLPDVVKTCIDGGLWLRTTCVKRFLPVAPLERVGIRRVYRHEQMPIEWRAA